VGAPALDADRPRECADVRDRCRRPWRSKATGLSELAGPDVLTYQEIMDIYVGEFVGKKPIVVPVPVLTPKLSSYWLYFVTSVPPTTAMSLVEGLAHDYVGDDREIRELVPQRLLTLRESIAVTLEAEKSLPDARTLGRGVHRLSRLEPALLVLREEVLRRTRDPRFPRGVVRGAAAVRQGWRFLLVSPAMVAAPRVRLADRRPELPYRPARFPIRCRMGDVVDGWRVPRHESQRAADAVDADARARLGSAGIQHRERGDRRVVELCAYWHPAGFWGSCTGTPSAAVQPAGA